jgi:succinate dehydrogenase / fumarate reductase, cytochrome b subunit
MASGNRPLSPHLQVYRPQVTSMLSILHRLTGVALVGGALIFTYWISSATYGPEVFAQAQWILGSWFGRLVLFGMAFSLYYHLGNGIRHMAWDVGWGYEMPTLMLTGWLVVLFAGAMSLLTFAAAYVVAGAL